VLCAARLRMGADADLLDDPPPGTLGASASWHTVVDTLRSLTNLIPTASNTIKKARTDVSKAASNFRSIFGIFEVKGPKIFEVVASLNSIIWTCYYCVLFPLSLLILYYAFWASGYFGGPQPLPKLEDEVEAPRTWRQRCGVCYTSCLICCTNYHDTQLCFWSAVLLMQIIVLLMFVISIVLCVLAGIKAFITAGCSQVYLLGDSTVCSAMLATLQNFLSTFFVQDAVEALDDICPANNLLTCQLITENMQSSTILTTIFGFLGTLLTMQILVESAVLHEQARYRRMFNMRLAPKEGIAA